MESMLSIAVGVVLLALLVISCMKGRWWCLLFFLLPIAFLALPFTAWVLAKPRSLWAKRFYNDAKMRRSIEKYETLPRGYKVVQEDLGSQPEQPSPAIQPAREGHAQPRQVSQTVDAEPPRVALFSEPQVNEDSRPLFSTPDRRYGYSD
jgi:energy-coupling factor transporter transmembrane protein EcfT